MIHLSSSFDRQESYRGGDWKHNYSIIQVLITGTNFSCSSRDMIPVLIHCFFFSWKRQLWKLPFGPSNNSHHCTVQETSMRILSTSRNISSNYTLWVQENNHRMSLRTQWTYCESDFSLTNGVNNLASKCPYFTWKITMFLGTFWNLLQLKISFQ